MPIRMPLQAHFFIEDLLVVLTGTDRFRWHQQGPQLLLFSGVCWGSQRVHLLGGDLFAALLFQMLVMPAEGTGQGSDKRAPVALMLIHPSPRFVELRIRRLPKKPGHAETCQKRSRD